jgi:chemotaxis protein histidine kinase CheA
MLRLVLHTAKGVFGQFSLHGLAQQIHVIEDKATIEPTDLHAVDASLHALLEHNAQLWDIRLERTDKRYSTTESTLASIEATVAGATSLEALKRSLREDLAAIRCKSVSELVGPLAQSCAQHAERRGKRVRFELEGGDVRWPSRLAEVFVVLPHLIRNSIDHGIEAPDERHGKSEVATIRLGVSANDNGLRISLKDDGRGIAIDRLGRRAVEVGVISEAQLAAMSFEQQLQLIFASGLSTAEQVSETSGRGVGMSAVKQTVEALGGKLTLTSQTGGGTEFAIDFAAAKAS